MHIQTIFEGAQTYIGVLATFIVLCLFISKSETESNFIIYTIQKVGEDLVKHLIVLVDEIKNEIRNKYEGGIKNGVIEDIINGSEKIGPAKKIKLLQNQRNNMMLTQRFIHKATTALSEFAPGEQLKNKEELPYISLLCLCLIITVMFVDCMDFIPIYARCLFLNMLLCFSLMFIAVLYHKYLYDNPGEEPKDETGKKPYLPAMFISFLILPTLWLFLAPFICAPWAATLILAILLAGNCYITKRKWVKRCHINNRYNRSLVLKHYTLFLLYILALSSIICSWIIFLPKLGYDDTHLKYWISIISFLSSQEFCYYFTLIFFTFNAIFGPILIGYIYLAKNENRVIRNIRDQQKEIQPLIEHLADEYKRIVITE